MNLKVKMFTEDGDNQIRVLLPYHKTITGFPQWKDKKRITRQHRIAIQL